MDRQIDTVAIGDPRIVSAAPVRRGSDVFDLVLQPQSDVGKTNMVVWLGDVTTVWNLEVGPGLRTADVVFVVTHTRAAQAGSQTDTTRVRGIAPDSFGAHEARRGAILATTRVPQDSVPPATTTVQAQAGREATNSAQTSDKAPSISTIELHETVGPVKATFRAGRTRSGIVLRYEITNDSDENLAIKPNTVLVRADGRSVAYGMLRESVDRSRLAVIPRGATERGAIDVAIPAAREIELTLSLLPVSTPMLHPTARTVTPPIPEAHVGTTPSVPLPFVFQASFSGLDRLPIAPLS